MSKLTKYQNIEGKVFKMLQNPVPLTLDASFPCAVQFINDDSPMGKYNKMIDPYTGTGAETESFLEKIFFCRGIDNENEVMLDNDVGWLYPCYQIVGYPSEDIPNIF